MSSLPTPNPQEMEAALRTLRWLAENPDAVDDALGRATARAYKRVRKQRRIRAARAHPKPQPPLVQPLHCYICQRPFELHGGEYPKLCPACSLQNAARRDQRGDLQGRTALVTGARIKVGYHTALKFLRDGARVIATTRFPALAAARYAAEPDFTAWSNRLSLRGLDLRDPRAIHALADTIAEEGLDILINNAAQTLRRPPQYYHALHAAEAAARAALPSAARDLLAWEISQLPAPPLPQAEALDFPHSWHLPLEQVDTRELAEVLVINAMAPFILCSRLEPILRRSRFPDRYIVNVTSTEGQFNRTGKPSQHPHTNMAKAALNMLTRTVAERCAADGIYVNSVDPGWITHMIAQDPAAHAEASSDVPPLTAVDGAARIYDPILRGIGGNPVSGLLLRDYQSVSW